MITLSRNEIRAECEKALRGTGLAWGFARDGGIMAAWLCGRGQPFLGGMNRAVEHLAERQGDASAGMSGGDKAAWLIAPALGLMLAEHVAATGESWTGQVLAPRYLLAGIGILASEQGAGLALFRGEQLLAMARGDDVFARTDAADGWADGTCTLCRAVPETNMPRDLPRLSPLAGSPARVPDNCWQRLNVFAKKTYVPETEEKRARGAGAGDIDNT